MLPLHHFYHCYCDGDWLLPVQEHFDALVSSGLYDALDTLHVGFVGSEPNIAAARSFLADFDFETCAMVAEGFEQETLDHLWEFSFNHDGLCFYAHTKGAANYASINDAWRRSMTFFNVIGWRRPVTALTDGKAIAGCHWIRGNPDEERLVDAWRNRHLNPPGLDGVGGMFGGNFWWARLDLIRRNCEPTRVSRMDAEHWLGQLSEVVPINDDTIFDMNPNPITRQHLVTRWDDNGQPVEGPPAGVGIDRRA